MIDVKELQPGDKGVILLTRTKMMDNPAPDSIRIKAECGCECWIALETMAMHMDPDTNTRTACLDCEHIGIADLRALALKKLVGDIPGQREAMTRNLGAAETNALYRFLGLD